MSLTAKRKKFVEAFCGPAWLNATQAAKDAGYAPNSAHVEGHQLLRNPKVRVAIAKRLEQYSMSAAEATARMAEMARGDLPTKAVRRETAKDGVLVTEEFNTETATDKILRIHGSYDEPEGEVKFLIVGSLDDVVPYEDK